MCLRVCVVVVVVCVCVGGGGGDFLCMCRGTRMLTGVYEVVTCGYLVVIGAGVDVKVRRMSDRVLLCLCVCACSHTRWYGHSRECAHVRFKFTAGPIGVRSGVTEV